jgi:hypothetical protein
MQVEKAAYPGIGEGFGHANIWNQTGMIFIFKMAPKKSYLSQFFKDNFDYYIHHKTPD